MGSPVQKIKLAAILENGDGKPFVITVSYFLCTTNREGLPFKLVSLLVSDFLPTVIYGISWAGEIVKSIFG